MTISRVFSLCAIFPILGLPQLVTFGVQGGAPAQVPLGQTTSKLPFAFGPTITLRATPRISLESGILFYRLGKANDNFAYSLPENTFTLGFEERHGRAIELPLLLRYRFRSESRAWQPFISAGPAVRRTSVDFTRFTSVFSNSPANAPPVAPVIKDTSVKWNVDPVFGVGTSFRAGRLHLEPQARYSYWGAGKNSAVLKNQVQFLFGLRF